MTELDSHIHIFAYGSNMNPERVRERGLGFRSVAGARLPGFRLQFDKTSSTYAGVGHANVHVDHGSVVEGVLYWLHDAAEIQKMDRFERTPINYSRDIVTVHTAAGPVLTWTYFANPAVHVTDLAPSADYLAHLLAGEAHLSDDYIEELRGWLPVSS